MNSFKERKLREKIAKQVRMSILLDAISKVFEEDSYEELSPLLKINIISLINNHAKLDSRIES
tara:strand:- start:4600 stop:4788 length:189 start_codon:yes stop_codon:yes gene_type:complete